jgi:hypothetical protein
MARTGVPTMKIWRPWIEHIRTDSLVLDHITRVHLLDWPVRLYVHNIPRADADRFLHNHPRPFISVVLHGGYVERTCVDRHASETLRDVGRPFGRRGSRFNVMSVERFHRIVHVEPNTWTLFVGRCRKEAGGWGFLAPETRHVIPQELWVNHPDRPRAAVVD